MISLADPQNLSNPIGKLFASAGTVRKVSDFILQINGYAHAAVPSRPAAAASVDLRGNTEETWRSDVDCLYKNVLSSKLEKLFK
ncbi:DUF2380 domain-containing protein [Mesorhizobium sp. M0140]